MSANPTYKPSEGKREEFRKYLEKNGVMDALTKVLVNLYEEIDKPEDALEYIRDKLAIEAGLETHKQLQSKLEETQARVAELEQQIEELKVSEPAEEGPVADQDEPPESAEPPQVDAPPQTEEQAEDAIQG